MARGDDFTVARIVIAKFYERYLLRANAMKPYLSSPWISAVHAIYNCVDVHKGIDDCRALPYVVKHFMQSSLFRDVCRYLGKNGVPLNPKTLRRSGPLTEALIVYGYARPPRQEYSSVYKKLRRQLEIFIPKTMERARQYHSSQSRLPRGVGKAPTRKQMIVPQPFKRDPMNALIKNQAVQQMRQTLDKPQTRNQMIAPQRQTPAGRGIFGLMWHDIPRFRGVLRPGMLRFPRMLASMRRIRR